MNLLLKSNYLFVYGTLRRDCKDSKFNLISSFVEFVGVGKVRGKLYKISWYPALVLDKNRYVVGEIYKIKDKRVFEILDKYEGCSKRDKKPYEYIRKILKVKVDNRYLNAWCYIYNWSLKNKKIVSNCNWCE